MSSVSPQAIYDNLALLEQGSLIQSAQYRQQAQDVIADLQISLPWRQMIADRLNEANRLLGLLATDPEDSY